MAEAQLSMLEHLDAQLEQLFAGWNGLSTFLIVALIAVVFAPLFLTADPDVHPFLLLRQSTPSLVRQPGESAVYRSAEVPHGYPLRSGLNVKDEGTPAYVAGRDGDLRDVWNKMVKEGGDGQKFIAVRGVDIVNKRSPKELTKEIVAVGSHLQSQGSKRVLVLLHNSVEQVLAVFAGSFYGFSPVLVSPARYNEAILAGIIKHTTADALIAPAGLLPPAAIAANKGLKTVIWVVEPNSRHMDFGEGVQWHELAEKASSAELPKRADGDKTPTPNLVFLQPKTSSGEAFEGDFVEFTPASVVSAVAAQASALPRKHVLQASDVILPLDSLADLYPLTVTLAGLWQGASLALIPAAGGSKVDFDIAFATKGLTPTVVITSSTVLAQARSNKLASAGGLLASVQRSRGAKALAAGTHKLADIGPAGKALRIIYVSETPTAAGDSVPLSGQELTDLRFLTRSRIIYALVVPRVAGAVAQTSLLDYRSDGSMAKRNHFGPPLSSVELRLADTATRKITDENVTGEIVATGPAVLGGLTKTGVLGKMRDDGTLALV